MVTRWNINIYIYIYILLLYLYIYFRNFDIKDFTLLNNLPEFETDGLRGRSQGKTVDVVTAL